MTQLISEGTDKFDFELFLQNCPIFSEYDRQCPKLAIDLVFCLEGAIHLCTFYSPNVGPWSLFSYFQHFQNILLEVEPKDKKNWHLLE